LLRLARTTPAPPESEPVAGGGKETILVVDDDETVRRFIRRALLQRGYEVHEAEDGHSALRILDQHRREIDLMITDLVMPGMGTPELTTRATALRPGLKILCISGYAQESLLREAAVVDRTPFLEKPFTPMALARKVRAVLDTGSAQAA
jgi:CheY-like chemotaxis protein